MCGREIGPSTKGFCTACWYPLARPLAARLHRHVSAAEVAAMLLNDYWPIWEHYRGRAA
jgi:hypothetical protein